MEPLRFSRGLVTPLILYGRVIFSRNSRTLLWSVFIELRYLCTFVSRRLLTPDCVSSNVMLLIQYGLHHCHRDSKTFPLVRVASIVPCYCVDQTLVRTD